jgi:hypothetical protein
MKCLICSFVFFSLGCGANQKPQTSSWPVENAAGRTFLLHHALSNPESGKLNEKYLRQVSDKVHQTLIDVYAKQLSDEVPNWIAMHALLSHGVSAYSQRNNDSNVSLRFTKMLNSNTERGGPFVIRTGRPWPRQAGPLFGHEHHPNQFLHIFSMAGIPLDADLVVDGHHFTVRDLLNQSLAEARPEGELAFTVSAYVYYLDVGARWRNKFGESMSLALIVSKLLSTPEATCAGEHRLGALSRILSHSELQHDSEMQGLWHDIQREVNDHITLLQECQQPDGSFNLPSQQAALFGINKQEHPGEFDVFCIGHTLEWISTYGDKDLLSEKWIVRATNRLADAVASTHDSTIFMFETKKSSDSVFRLGQLMHAISGLRRWSDKVDGSAQSAATVPLSTSEYVKEVVSLS